MGYPVITPHLGQGNVEMDERHYAKNRVRGVHAQEIRGRSH